MSQIHIPVTTPARAASQPTAPGSNRWVDVAVIVAFVALAYGIVMAASRWATPLTPTTQIDLSPRSLPYYALLSTLRMAVAYVISLAFTLIYARTAAASRRAERVMLPVLDILQSIPILSFLPGVELALVALFPHSQAGLELAAILLIFTSQAWNMAFSFHQSLITLPKELREAASVYRLNPWQRFTRLELPFGTIPLIWNSMMSWAGGWFFLIAAEQFSLGTRNFELPGLGSYLATAANAGDVGALLLGLLALIVVIVLLDQLVWRPLIAWADRFKIEQTASGQAPTSAVLRALRRSALLDWLQERVFSPARESLDRLSDRLFPDVSAAPALAGAGATAGVTSGQATLAVSRDAARSPQSRIIRLGRSLPLRRILGFAVLAVLAALSIWGVLATLRLLAQLGPGDWGNVAVSAVATLLRTATALAIGVAWTVPIGVAIGLNPRLARLAQPIVQMVASIPATALFPVLLLVLVGLPGGLNIAAVALMLLGTQWYILFNVIAGAMAIPTDLREAAAIYQLSGWRRWRYLILPAIFPYLVTGMLTASGGAWNASVVSEYVTFNNHTFTTVGLGALIASSYANQKWALLIAATLAMAAVVVTINRLLWRRLYRLAEQKYHID